MGWIKNLIDKRIFAVIENNETYQSMLNRHIYDLMRKDKTIIADIISNNIDAIGDLIFESEQGKSAIAKSLDESIDETIREMFRDKSFLNGKLADVISKYVDMHLDTTSDIDDVLVDVMNDYIKDYTSNNIDDQLTIAVESFIDNIIDSDDVKDALVSELTSLIENQLLNGSESSLKAIFKDMVIDKLIAQCKDVKCPLVLANEKKDK
jgi:hypothetical protein